MELSTLTITMLLPVVYYHRISICVFVFVLCLRGRQLGGHRRAPRLPETIHPLVLSAPSLFQTPLGTITR